MDKQIVSAEEKQILEGVYKGLGIKDPYEEPRELAGLSDGGQVILNCSACRKPLMTIWITRPNESTKDTFQATCPYCGDKSWKKTVKGGVHVGGFEDKTVFDSITEEGDVKLFKILKVK
jgi:DNA-directed RNA polymerase subunit RPC12/RpoP